MVPPHPPSAVGGDRTVPSVQGAPGPSPIAGEGQGEGGRLNLWSYALAVEVSPGFDGANSPGTAGLDARTLWTLLTGNALTMIGIGFFLPILPLLIAARGGGASLVGLVFASGVVARALIQYPAGWLSDRVGRRAVILASLFLYAAIFPLYALPFPPAAILAVRFAHALAGGAYAPASLALIADLTRADRRGVAFSRLRASDTLGLLIGPVIGGLVAGLRLEYVFIVGAVVCFSAALLMLWLPRKLMPAYVK